MSFHSCWLQNLLRSLLTDLNGFCVLVIPRCKNVQIDVIINYKPKKKKRFHGFFFNFWQRHVRGKSVNFAGKTHNPWKKQKPVAQCRIFDWQLKHEKYKTRHFSLNGESLECNRSVWKMFLKPCFPCFSCCCCFFFNRVRVWKANTRWTCLAYSLLYTTMLQLIPTTPFSLDFLLFIYNRRKLIKSFVYFTPDI